MLDIAVNFDRIQFLGKLMIQTQENENLILGLILAHWAEIWVAKFFS